MCACVRWNNTKKKKNSQQLDLFLGEKRDLACWKQLLWRLNERAASTETLQGQDLTVALCQTSGRNTKCSLETQWRWRDLRRFTHLIVRPEWRSSPRRQVWLTSEAEARLKEKKSQTNEINKKKPRENRRKKHASTPANGVATSGIKKHTSTISWFVWSGRGGSRADTVEERACQLQSLSHIGFLRAEEVKPRGRGAATRTQLLCPHFVVVYGCVSGGYSRVSLPDFSPLPRSVGRSVCVGSLECGPTRQLQSRLRSRGAFKRASEKEI